MTDDSAKLDEIEGRLPSLPFFRDDPYEQVQKNLKQKIARYRAQIWWEEHGKSSAQPPTEKQVNYLSYLLGDHMGYYGLIQFVRFANAYHTGRLTRYHWIQAISLCKQGYNHWGNMASLMALAES